jgi:hypothetical protein
MLERMPKRVGAFGFVASWLDKTGGFEQREVSAHHFRSEHKRGL